MNFHVYHHFDDSDSRRVNEKLDHIVTLLTGLIAQGAQIMKSEQNLSDDIDAIQAGVTAALQSQADLKAQIAALIAGEPVSQDQLDALVAKADAIAASLSPAPPTA